MNRFLCTIVFLLSAATVFAADDSPELQEVRVAEPEPEERVEAESPDAEAEQISRKFRRVLTSSQGEVAADSLPGNNAKDGKPPSAFRSFVRFFFSMLILCGLLGGAFWMIRRYKFKLTGMDEQSITTILSRTALDTKNVLMVVRVRGREFLLGVGQNGVSLIDELDVEEEEREAGEVSDEAGI